MAQTTPRTNEARSHVRRLIESLDGSVQTLQVYVDSDNMPEGSQKRLDGLSGLARAFEQSLEKGVTHE